jgi:hypothetical protein
MTTPGRVTDVEMDGTTPSGYANAMGMTPFSAGTGAITARFTPVPGDASELTRLRAQLAAALSDAEALRSKLQREVQDKEKLQQFLFA